MAEHQQQSMDSASEPDNTQSGTVPFPVVGIGASVRGLAALTTFFAHMPPDSGMAFVVIAHASPADSSTLAALVERHTAMPVIDVTGSARIEPNHIYLLPPDEQLTIDGGTVQIVEREPTNGTHQPIDHVFRRLAAAYGGNTAAIVLSGSGSDGASDLGRIKEAGGVTLAQDPQDAEDGTMPRMAISTGLVDVVLPAADMPATLIAYWRRGALLTVPSVETEQRGDDADVLRDIFAILRAHTGHDFNHYKRPTIQGRLSRRMQVTGAPDVSG